jgi:hypothetical protein
MSAREGLIHGMVRYGERDVCGVFATTATVGCEDCIASPSSASSPTRPTRSCTRR